MVIPVDRDDTPEPARRRRVVGAGDFDAAVDMNGADTVLVMAEGLERQREQMRPLLGEHGGDLPLDGAVDARVVPAIEIRLAVLQAFEAQAP
jgi:hypothetical protein